MQKPTRFSLALLISAGALSAALSVPAVFAEGGQGGRGGGRGSDDVVTTVPPARDIDDNDVNDDRGKDAVVTTTAAAPTVAVEDRNDAGDDND
jgi:hypothetical protein